MSVFLPLGQDDGAENSDENEEGSKLSMRRGGREIAGGAHDGGGDESAHGESERNTREAREFRKVSALFFARVQKHDDEDEENHDGAAIDNDLDRGDELGAEKKIETGKGDHHNDERERAVDR